LGRAHNSANAHAWPAAAEIPQNFEILHASARQWDGAAADRACGLAKALDNAGQIEDAEVFRRLAAEEEKAAAGAVGAALPMLRNAADGRHLLEEAFDRFALIGERLKDEEVVAEEQRFSATMIARLALSGRARGNALLEVGRN
jgi:hypothetical protein